MDKETFSKHVLEYETVLYHIASSIMHDDEDSADAIQNALLKAYTSLPSLKKEKYFKTWLTRILINECYQMKRNRKEILPLDEAIISTLPPKESTDNSEIYIAVQQLEDIYKLPIILFYVEGYSVREISAILELSTSNVKTRLHRGRRILQDFLCNERNYERGICNE